MTEYEMADLTGAAMGNFLTAFTVYLTTLVQIKKSVLCVEPNSR